MKRYISAFMCLILCISSILCFAGCGISASENDNTGNRNDESTEEKETMTGAYKMKITVGDTVLIADMYDNATSNAIKEMLPMSLSMMDLYGREMCYRFADALPTDHEVSTGYELGELAYWSPRHSFVILYKQNGEHFSRQVLGKISSGYEIFDGAGDTTVKFELMED